MKIRKIFFHAVCLILILSVYVFFCAEKWFSEVFSVGIEQILFTIKNPMKNSNIDFLHGIFFYLSKRAVVLVAISYVAFAFLFEFIFSRIDVIFSISAGKKQFPFDVRKFISSVILIFFLPSSF